MLGINRFLIRSSVGGIAALAAVIVFAGPPTQVQVQSANIDGNTITVTLVNTGSKPAVAWTVDVRQYDASGAPLPIAPLIVGHDYVFSLLYPGRGHAAERDQLMPGAQKTIKVGADPNAASATATLLAVIYADRTSEGDPKQVAMFFSNRAMFARRASEAANLLATPPSSDSDKADRISKLSQMKVLAHSVQDLLHGQGDWATAAAEQKALADHLTAQAQPGGAQ